MGEVAGEVETERGVLVLKRVHVRYRLRADPARREVVERVRQMHADHCPVARSIKPCIAVTTEVVFDDSLPLASPGATPPRALG